MPTPESRSDVEEISADSGRPVLNAGETPKVLADLKTEMERRGWQCLRL